MIRAGGGRVGESFPVEGERHEHRPAPGLRACSSTTSPSRATTRCWSAAASDWYLDDCGSLNGTYVNRSRIESQRLDEGDELQIGKYKLTFHAR